MKTEEITTLLTETAESLSEDLEYSKETNNPQYMSTVLEIMALVKQAREKIRDIAC